MNARIAEAQRNLIRLGYDLGKGGPSGKGDDGLWGDKTEKALKAFQTKRGLLGDIGEPTMEALRESAPTAFDISKLDRAKFFAYLRSDKASMFGRSLSQSQVDGIEGILDAFEAVGDGRQKTLAYGLATARREVGSGMVPVREGFKKTDAEARAYVARNYPNKGYSKPAGPWGHVYYGRGIVQLTWLDNYEHEGIAQNPDKALEPKFAAELMFKGLQDGRWNGQGKGIEYYLPTDGPDDLKNARRTVNVTDHWDEIAGFYQQFMAAIDAAMM